MSSRQMSRATGGPRARRGSPLAHGAVLLCLAHVLCFASSLPAHAQDESITDVSVIAGGNSGIQCQPGFTKYDRDLNQGAGGDYVYLCYRMGVGAPITGLNVSVGGDSNPGDTQDIWTRVHGDLNQGAGGFYVFLWYTRAPDCGTIRAVHVRVDNQNPAPPGYVEMPFDLNRGTDKHNNYLYLSYLKN